jgi:hypothetical protein
MRKTVTNLKTAIINTKKMHEFKSRIDLVMTFFYVIIALFFLQGLILYVQNNTGNKNVVNSTWYLQHISVYMLTIIRRLYSLHKRDSKSGKDFSITNAEYSGHDKNYYSKKWNNIKTNYN